MKKNSFKKQVVVMVLVAFFAVGIPTFAFSSGVPKEIKAGVILPLSGPLASIGKSSQNGLVMAVDYINQDGGIKSLNGAKVRLIFADDEAKPDVGISEAERLIGREQVDVLLGSYSSAVTFAITQVAEKNQLPIIAANSAKEEITERGFKYTFRMCPKSTWIANDQMDFLKWISAKTNTPIKTLGLLYEDSAWGQSFARTFKEPASKSGYKFPFDISYSAKDTKDFRSIILKAKEANPDMVVQVSYTMDAILIMKTMHELQFDCKGILATGSGHTTDEFHKGVGGLDEYLVAWDFWNESISLREVKERAREYSPRFGKPIDQFAASWYTVGYFLAKALNEAKSVEKQKIRDALRKVDLKVGEKGNLFLIPISFDENGQNPNAKGIQCQILKGKWEVLYPEVGATAKPIFPVPSWAKRK
jgi:branched-chain amino acid transport system substrate-binding protein